jgi:hypothetical protein
MRRPLMLLVILLALVLGVQSVAGAALYRGANGNAKVEFRVEGGMVTFARVRTSLHCTRRGEPLRRPYGKAFFPKALGGGRFEEDFSTEEPGYFENYELTGKVQGGKVTGRFEYERSLQRSETCRASFSFTASRQSGAS